MKNIFGILLIAITRRPGSALAEAADIALDLPDSAEACPMGLAPTTSTVMMMALGDALAVAWMTEKGVSVEDFAMNHPAGSIGRRLTLTVADLMIPREKLEMVRPDAKLPDVLEAMTALAIGAVLVADAERPLALGGIITDGDLRRALKRNQPDKWGLLTARDLMTATPISITSVTPAIDALTLMERNARKARQSCVKLIPP